MRKLFYIILSAIMLPGCMIEPPQATGLLGFGSDESGEKPTVTIGEDIPEDFGWETIKYQAIEIINTNTTVYNKNNELIAHDLPFGTYILPMKYNDSIIAVQEVVITLAPSANPSNSPSDNLLYFPAQGKYGTFMAEDLFPYKGDKDFNDVVFDFNFSYNITDDGTGVKEMTLSVKPRAVGGTARKIGVGLKFYSPDIKIASVSGNSLGNGGLFGNLNTNGTESGQSTCTVVPILDDIRSHFDNGEGFINSYKGSTHVGSSQIDVTICFQDGHYPQYNDIVQHLGSYDCGISLFVTIDDRSKEIFPKSNVPTDKFDRSLFKNTGKEDFSDSDNFAWVIQSTEAIAHPTELTAISDAYPAISDWMLSGGQQNTDWYLYPDKSKIY